MTPTPESQSQRLLETFTTAVNSVSGTVAMPEAVRKSVQDGCTALVEQVRSHIHLRSFALRALLMVEIKLHQLRTLAEADPRVELLRGLQTALQAHATVSSVRSVAEAPVAGYYRSVRDSFVSGVTDDRRREAMVTSVAGAATVGFGIFSAFQAMRERGNRLMAWLAASVASFAAFAGLGTYANVRAETGRPGSPEGEARTYGIDAPGTTMTVGGLTLSRITGGDVVIVHGGTQYRIVLPSVAASSARPMTPETSVSALMSRVFTAPSTGTGIGIERQSIASRASMALPEVFRIAGPGLTALQTAVSTGVVPPTGASASVPFSFRIQHITPEQVDFIRRCIANGATMDANNEWLTVTTPVRVLPVGASSAPLVAPAAVGTPERAVQDLNAPAATGAVDAIAAITNANLNTTTVTPANHATIQAQLKVLHDIIDAVPLPSRNAAMTAAATALLSRASLTARGAFQIQGGARFNLSFSAWRFAFSPAAPLVVGPFAAVVTDLRDNGPAKVDALLDAMDNAAVALGTHTGNPATLAAISPSLTQLNALIPAGGARTDTGVATAATNLLGHPTGDPARDRTYNVGSPATVYRLHFNAATGQYAFRS